MKGLLIYDAVGFARNSWFAKRLEQACKKQGLDLNLCVLTSETVHLPLVPDFAAVRVANPALTKKLEDAGVRTFNNYKTSFVANDKWQTYLFLKENGFRVMETEEGFSETLPFPYVLKSVDGHGGSEVFLVKTEEEKNKLKAEYSSGRRFVSQKFCSSPGRDLRVYVLGGKVLAGAMRSSSSDFRSNYSLGGTAEIVQVPPNITSVAERIAAKLQSDFVGVDFIFDGDDAVVNEVEDVVGTRMLYDLTDLDAAEEYAKYIAKKLK